MPGDRSESRRAFEDERAMGESGECRGARTGRARRRGRRRADPLSFELHPRDMGIYRGDPNVLGQVASIIDLLEEHFFLVQA